MKLRCFTSLIATMVIAGTAGAFEIYDRDGHNIEMFGSVVGGNYWSNNNVKSGDHSFLRYGLIGKTRVNDKIIAFGMWENEIYLNTIENSNVKNNQVLLGYAGIKFGNLGSIDYGRNYGIMYDIKGWTDVVPSFGGDTSVVDNFLSSRASNVVTYRNKNFFGLINGLSFAFQYQGENSINKKTGRSLKDANGDGVGVSVSYDFNNGISTGFAYSNSKRVFEQKILDNNSNGYDNNAEAYSVGLRYDSKKSYAAAVYEETRNMTPFGNFNYVINPDNIYGFIKKLKNIELVAQYQFDCGLRPCVSYLQSQADNIINGYKNCLKKYITVGTSYQFNKNISTTIDYRINLLKKSEFTNSAQIVTDDILGLGILYVF